VKPKYEIISKKNLYKGFFESNELKLKFRKHDGSWSPVIKREVFGGAHVSTLLPYDPKKDEIILIQQFRAGVISRCADEYLYEIVAGIIDDNENPEETAKRECFEETGCNVKDIMPIQNYFPAPGSSESFYHVFLGEVESFKGERITGLENENEDILVKSFSVNEVKNLLNEKKIINGVTLIALQWFFLNYYNS